MKTKCQMAVAIALAVMLGGCAAEKVRPAWTDTTAKEPSQASAEPGRAAYDLGVRYLSDGNYEEAVLQFTASIEIEPRADAYAMRAEAYDALGQPENAESDYRRAIELEPERAEYYLWLADHYHTLDKPEQEAEILEEGWEKTGDPDIRSRLDMLSPSTPPLGLWYNPKAPANYQFTLAQQDDGTLTAEFWVIQGLATRIGTTEPLPLEFTDGAADFPYEDSFMNTGTVHMRYDGETMDVSFDTDKPYQGGWCIDAGVGAYVHESDMEIGPGHISATLTQEDVDATIEEYVPKIWLYPDGRFRFRVNLLEGMGTITGEYRTYSYQNTIYRIDFEVQDRSFSGFTGDDVSDFALQGSSEEGRFSFLCYSSIGATGPYGSTFVLETDGE